MKLVQPWHSVIAEPNRSLFFNFLVLSSINYQID